LALIVDPGLAEKDFGWKESTRGGVHVAGYPKGHGSGESRTEFATRVYKVGLGWLNAASALACSSPASASTPHIVLVSHGMWISSFFICPSSDHNHTGIGDDGCAEEQSGAVTELFRANDIRHLENVKRHKGGIGRGAFVNRQTKLSSLFAKPASASASQTQLEPDAPEAGASPTKKRKT
ncbi:hypothetical protein, partial [Sporisorium scitamineum]